MNTTQSPTELSSSALVRGGLLKILRVYNNGDRLAETLPHAQAMAEIEYSKKMRPGCALFVGTECVQAGYLSMDRLVAIGHELSANSVLSKPHNQHDETTNSPTNGNHTVDVDPGTQPADASHRSGHTGVRAGMVN